MRSYLSTCLFIVALVGVSALPTTLVLDPLRNVSQSLFTSLEELARIVDISYCVGLTGIQSPFKCLSRCDEFEGFELVTTWNTGPLLSDSCGYIAISHPPHPKRVIVAFRGTYSIANTVVDLSTNPAEYAPFPSDGGDHDSICSSSHNQKGGASLLPQILKHQKRGSDEQGTKCTNCTVHAGFMTSWRNTRCTIIPDVENALARFPDYQLTLVGHSLGGAVAALAALEFQARGLEPQVTTFGEPRVGNHALSSYIDQRFNVNEQDSPRNTYRRVTHVNDPVPLLPLEEWGYRMHAGEIFISKPSLSPSRADLRHCVGDEDPTCISSASTAAVGKSRKSAQNNDEEGLQTQGKLSIPTRYKLWELFFAHRDYFWRLGLCVPGGDPKDWWRDKYPRDFDVDEL